MTNTNLGEDRRLPPLPRMDPLPRGPFNPFQPNDAFAPSTPGAQESFQFKSPWSGSDQIVAPPSPANSAESSWQESFAAQKATSTEWPTDLSQTEIMSLIAPQNINRKAPLQQLCGRKRKGSTISPDPDDQREKHRIAEGNRRKNLSQLHRELDSRIHDFFLERAGWNPSKSLPQSKEHIVQGAVYLIDFMLAIIVHLIRQEQMTPQLSEKLQPQIRCMQLQQLVTSLQQQNQTTQQQLRAAKAVFEKYGFEENLVDMSGGMSDEEIAKFWANFIAEKRPHFRLSPIDQLPTYVIPVWEAIVDSAIIAEEGLNAHLARIKPDLVAVDNVILFPAIKRAGCPWVRIISCSENEIPDPDIPPHLSGLSADDKKGFRRYRERFGSSRSSNRCDPRYS